MPKKTKRPEGYFLKLAGRIKEKYGTQSEFAYAMKTSTTYVNTRLCQKVDFTAKDISRWCDLLGIRSDEINEYFMPEWRPKADRIVPSGKARAMLDSATGKVICNAFNNERN